MNVMLRFERGRDDAEPLILGPFPFVQLTYGSLRGPEGETIAFNPSDDDWRVTREYVRAAGLARGAEGPWSDVVIYAEEPNS